MSPSDRTHRWGRFLAAQAARTALGPIINLLAALPLGMACVLLAAAWQTVPQRLVLAQRFEKLTTNAQGKIVDSWLALELDPTAIGTHTEWHPWSKASYCAVVEYEGAWGAPARRAFCGTKFPFDEGFELPERREMAPGVVFSWPRDERGIVVPEVRIAPGSLAWLSSHPAGFAWPDKPPPPTALAALRLALDRPVDGVVAGWSLPVPAFPLLLDPAHPEEPLPAGYVARQLEQAPGAGNWIGCVVLTAMGLFVWLETMGFLVGKMPRWAFWVVALVPLSTLPWWTEQAPRVIRHLNSEWGDVVEGMLNDLTKVDRLLATDPANATLAHGERLIWRMNEGAYADTFGRFALNAADNTTAAPGPLAAVSDEALERLVSTITTQVRALSATEQRELFGRLERDVHDERLHAAIVFLRAAKQAIVDPQSSPELSKAASDFLWAWVLAPVDTDARELAMGERHRLSCELVDVPVPEIANMTSSKCRAEPASP